MKIEKIKNQGQAIVESLFTTMMILGFIMGISQLALVATGQMTLLLSAQQAARSNVVREDIESGYWSMLSHSGLVGHFEKMEEGEADGVKVSGWQSFIFAAPFFDTVQAPVIERPSLVTGGLERSMGGMLTGKRICEMPQTPEEGTDFYDKAYPDSPKASESGGPSNKDEALDEYGNDDYQSGSDVTDFTSGLDP